MSKEIEELQQQVTWWRDQYNQLYIDYLTLKSADVETLRSRVVMEVFRHRFTQDAETSVKEAQTLIDFINSVPAPVTVPDVRGRVKVGKKRAVNPHRFKAVIGGAKKKSGSKRKYTKRSKFWAKKKK